MNGTLYLLPNRLGPSKWEAVFPPLLHDVVQQIDGLIAESPKVARAYLKEFAGKEDWRETPICELSEHTTSAELNDLLLPLRKGEVWGLISDAGLTCLADPGAQLVARARENNIAVRTLPGPSSIVMALQLSGFSHQRFSFVSYPPRKEEDFQRWLKKMERRIDQEQETILFIEPPYKTETTLKKLLSSLSSDRKLAVAVDLTLPTEEVFVKKVSRWKNEPLPELHKRPAIFLLN